MNEKSTRIRRECHITTFYTSIFYRLFPPFLGKILLSLLPAVFYSCENAAEIPLPEVPDCVSKVSLSGGGEDIGSLDIFVFRDDRLRKLDCYQRFEDFDMWKGAVVSGRGGRIVTAVANSPRLSEDWAAVNSLSALEGMALDLEDESYDSPSMSGEIRIKAGDGGGSAEASLQLRPFMSEVTVRSLECDFSGKAYAGEKIRDAKVYLTNVNAECLIGSEEEAAPRRIVNAGRLREEDVLRFRDPGLVVREVGDFGNGTVFPEISLRCYQNNYPEETPGTPFTRLVIEGKVSGHTYYWPININRDTEDEAGIWRNRRYIYDIRIMGKGSDDPDIPVKPEVVEFNKKVLEWEEKEEYGVTF